MEVELRERRSGSANKTPRLRGPKIPRSRGTEVRTIEARVTYQNIGKMAQGSELGVVTRMVPECSQSVWRWSGVSEVGVEVHGYDTTPDWNMIVGAAVATQTSHLHQEMEQMHSLMGVGQNTRSKNSSSSRLSKRTWSDLSEESEDSCENCAKWRCKYGKYMLMQTACSTTC